MQQYFWDFGCNSDNDFNNDWNFKFRDFCESIGKHGINSLKLYARITPRNKIPPKTIKPQREFLSARSTAHSFC